MLSKSSTGYSDENDGFKEVVVNTKCKISMPYIVDNNATSVSIVSTRGAELKDIPITE